MVTTLDIDEDILSATQALAKKQGVPLGKLLSDLARQALAQQSALAVRNGVPLFPKQPIATAVTLEVIQQLQDEVA